MKKNQIILLVFSCLLAIGTFMPLISLPIFGSITYFHNGDGDGKYILMLAAVAGGLAFTRFIKAMAIPGIIAVIILGWFLINYQDNMSSLKGISEDPGMFGGISRALKQSISISYGYVIMAISALAITILPFWLEPQEDNQ